MTSTNRSLRRRLAVPLLVLALAGGGTVATGGTASAAPPQPGGTAHDPTDLGLVKDGDRIDLTGGAGRRPFDADRTRTPGSGTERRAAEPASTGRYIVELAEEPVTTYQGGVSGLARTRPAAGEQLAPQSTAAQAYRKHLDAQRAAVAGAAGVTVTRTYTTAFNGFSAKLTPEQVAALRRDHRVRSVTESRLVTTGTATPDGTTPDTRPSTPVPGAPATADPAGTATGETTGDADDATADRSGKPGKPGKPDKPKPGSDTGAGVVIGVLDTGIWPESPSFAKRMPAPAGWHGTCQTGAAFVVEHCNGKIVGARYFADAYLAVYGELPPGELLSARDMSGHGTHTASTAAGLPIRNVTISGRDFGPVGGVAPDAQIAAYKVLWGGEGFDEDIIAGIDAAVADGVQVINYSIGMTFGDQQPNTPIGNAFLNAALAGVFVSAAAGNDGMSGMIANAQPWVTTVGAAVTTPNEGTVRLGDGSRIVGTSLDVLPGGRKPLPLVFGEQAGSPENGSAYCVPGSIDPAKVQGKVVACALSNPYDSVQELKAKGAAAMLLFDPIGNFRVNSLYDFPVLYLPTREQSGTLFNYLMRHPTDATALVGSGGDGSSVPGLPSVADFSSKGPDQVHYGLFKPDLVAPGSDVLAAVSPPGNFGREYDVYSGTSMAAPQVAGAAAVLRAKHPTWSAAAVASALRTTATDTEGTDTPLAQGSGMLALDRADDPGLVFEPAAADLVAFSEAATPDGRDLNLPAISLREYDGTRPVTLTRKLTNVGGKRETYRASVSGLPGMRVTVSPSSVTVDPGKTVTVTITLRRGDAPWDRYVTGAITWHSHAHQVRIPVAARPWGITPRPYDDEQLEFGRLTTGAFGLLEPGFTGPISGRSTGYTPIEWNSYSMPAGVDGGVFDRNGLGVRAHTFTVPKGSAGIVVQTGTDDPNADLDLFLYKGDKLMYRSANWHSSEQAYVFLPEPGTYTAYVFAYTASGPVVDYRLGHAVLSRTGRYAPATLTLPATVERGTTPQFTLRPDSPLTGDGEYWAYTELRIDGEVVPGQLVYTSRFWWQ
ncbi:S8 family serine peptidase [Plantactinospora sp. B5E13]|uniref:S8 family serine peptidase n=1 Tax=Plantactinospora sp. B5E13 TaxID=3153758 RepID=UPI00325C95F2